MGGPGRIEAAVTVARPRDEVWRFWRRLENLPRAFRHLEAIEELEGERSRWRARVPGAGEVEWEAEIVEEREGESLAWRSLPGSGIDTEGQVVFRDAPRGGTEVRLAVRYGAVARKGLAGRAIEAMSRHLLEDELGRLKSLLEAGE